MPIGDLATASADDCPDIEVIFARGTNDAPGLGDVGGAFVDSLRGKVGGRSVGAYAVNYPATYDFLAGGRRGQRRQRPHPVHDRTPAPTPGWCWAATRRARRSSTSSAAVPMPVLGFNNPLPPDAPDHVAAIAAFGNPSRQAGPAADDRARYGVAGPSTCATAAIRSARPTARTSPRTAPYAGGPTIRRPTSRRDCCNARYTTYHEARQYCSASIDSVIRRHLIAGVVAALVAAALLVAPAIVRR